MREGVSQALLELLAAERQSIALLEMVLEMCVEAFAFLALLGEADFPRLLKHLSERELAQLRELEFCELATTHQGEQLAFALIGALTRCYTEDDHWLDRLQRECKHFFG